MKAAPFQIVAINVFATAALMFGASFLFDDPIRLVLRGASLADLLLGIFFWSKAKSQRAAANSDHSGAHG